jgi:hypothetical protein
MVLAGLATATLATADTSAQSPLSVQLSPLVGYGNAGGVTAVPDASSPSTLRTVQFDANFMVGLTAELEWAGPVGLRAGASRTLGGNLRTFSGWEGCGSNCSRALYSDVGSTTATTLWADLMFRPFSGELAPYAFGGLARRFRSYAEADPAIAPYFERADLQTMLRFGAGLELDLSRTGSVWVEIARHRTDKTFGTHGEPRWSQSDTQLTTGFKLRLF